MQIIINFEPLWPLIEIISMGLFALIVCTLAVFIVCLWGYSHVFVIALADVAIKNRDIDPKQFSEWIGWLFLVLFFWLCKICVLLYWFYRIGIIQVI